MKRDLRSVIFLTLLLGSLSGILQAQNTISSVRVYSNPAGARFVVDGLMYNGSQTFLWPAGSKHTVQFPLSFLPDGTAANYQESLDGNTHFTAVSWTLANGVTPTTIGDLTVVADLDVGGLEIPMDEVPGVCRFQPFGDLLA